ncbi:hypothetical protein XELAEV_18018964mg [Xenopus laevis]|uniref:Adhesion G protein-coupled receptor E1 n=1 Tax=Xenopus laevis TaxID=8355 RepID=A0A974DEI2_XENLA|nr:hypothetical protein XELAEV_18018964mg [Xenopus laevis]
MNSCYTFSKVNTIYMSSSALWALDIFAGAKGAVNIPSKAVDFPQCHGDSSSCPNNSRCEEATSRGYYCICNSGFYNQVKDTHVSYPNGSCTDIDECTKFKNVCTRPAFCVNTIGSFLCNCPTGYVKQDINQSGRDVICEDAAKCRKTSECPPHSSCLGNTCVCEPGFRNRIGGTDTKRDGNCTDINECLLKPCAHPAVCNNMPGNYSCDCPEGYTKYFIIRGRRNLTSCAATNPTTCPAGYVMNFTGGVMECSDSHAFAVAATKRRASRRDRRRRQFCMGAYVKTPVLTTRGDALFNSRLKMPRQGIIHTGSWLSDYSKLSNPDPCLSDYSKLSNPDSCLPDYSKLSNPDPCLSDYSKLSNPDPCLSDYPVNYACTDLACLITLFWLILLSCVAFHPKSLVNNCAPLLIQKSCLAPLLLRVVGIRLAEGSTGSERRLLQGADCDTDPVDIDECLLKPCAHPAVCNNMPGNYSCDCPEGYTKYFIIRESDLMRSGIYSFAEAVKWTCLRVNINPYKIHIDEYSPIGRLLVLLCAHAIEGFFSTSQPTTVINFTTPSATNPTTCPAGYVMKFTGGVMECSDINECIEQPSACGNYSTCNNMIGSFMCNCQAGFRDIFPSGSAQISCTDVDECMEHPSPCGNNSLCKNTAGSFICSCKAGYKEVFQIGSSQLQCVAVKDLCGTYLQEQNKTLSNCYAKDPLCILQQSTYHLLESSCQDNRTKLDIKNITNSASEILSKPSWSALNSSEVSTAVNGLLETVETSVLKSFSKHPTNRNFSTPEIAVATKVVQENCSFLTLNVGLNSMNVSCELLPNPEDGAVFISYRDLNSILSGSLLLELEDLEKNNAAVVVNSQVVTGSITSRKKEKLNPPVTFYLNNLQAPDSSKTFLCVYWDLDLIGWSQRGCNITFSNVSHTLCSCDHLSSFAVIIAPCDIKEDRGLLVVSRIGLSVSLLCLSLSLLTFLLCRSLRSAHTSMLTALSGCLFLGQLIILFGLHQTQFPILCSIIAGCLHYILLCAFCWMTLESVLLFLTVRNLNAMNYLTSRRSHFPTACLIGFGVPAVIVTISAAVRSDGYGTKKSCWLNLNLIWSFLGPVSVFITINTILLILTLWLLRAKLASLNKNVSSLKNTRLLTFKALAQLFILGCTWVLGFFQCGTGAIVASYLFTICNSLQGAFIFLVHCLLNHQVREEYRKVFHRLHIKKPESETVSGSTLPMTLKSATISEVVKSDTVIDHHSELSKTELSKTEWCKTSDDTNH